MICNLILGRNCAFKSYGLWFESRENNAKVDAIDDFSIGEGEYEGWWLKDEGVNEKIGVIGSKELGGSIEKLRFGWIILDVISN